MLMFKQFLLKLILKIKEERYVPIYFEVLDGPNGNAIVKYESTEFNRDNLRTAE